MKETDNYSKRVAEFNKEFGSVENWERMKYQEYLQNLEKIKVKIEISSDGFFWAYAENAVGLNGGGETIEAVKQSIFECIEIQKELGNFPCKEYEVIFIEPTK